MSVSLMNGHIDSDMPIMTDEQIIKAFEYCATYDFCTGCPLVDDCPSNYLLQKLALDLINRQKAETKELNGIIHRQSDVISEQKEKLEELYKEIDRLSQCVLYHDGQIMDAIKDFVEKAKDIILEEYHGDDGWVFENVLDNLIEEWWVKTNEHNKR